MNAKVFKNAINDILGTMNFKKQRLSGFAQVRRFQKKLFSKSRYMAIGITSDHII